MSLYGHTYINIDSLKRWVNTLSLDGIQSVDVGGYNLEIKDETKESYIERMSKFETYAVITPDGKWHSKDKMGLFSVSTNEDDNRNKSFYDIFIKDADQELILVIVDCHI